MTVAYVKSLNRPISVVGAVELEYQFLLSKIPQRFQTINGQPASIQTVCTMFDESDQSFATFKAAAKQILDGGNTGIYLWSSMTGTGKSTAATALGCDYIVESVRTNLKRGRTSTKPYVLYVSMPMFLERVKQMYRDGNDDVLSQVNDMQRLMSDVPLLICDDLGVTYASESIQERLLAILEIRYDKPTLYTSNCSLNSLEDRLGARIVSRIHGTTMEIHVKGVDHRKDV